MSKKVDSCINCFGVNVLKNWTLYSWWQRYKCKDCEKSFTVWGVRWSYSEKKINDVSNAYIHNHISARDLAKQYNLSTSTIVNRGKNHKNNCKICQDK